MMDKSFFHIDPSVTPGYICVSGNCVFSGVGHAVQVKETEWDAYYAGAPAQVAFPTMSPGDREFLMSGITSDAFDAAFSEND